MVSIKINAPGIAAITGAPETISLNSGELKIVEVKDNDSLRVFSDCLIGLSLCDDDIIVNGTSLSSMCDRELEKMRANIGQIWVDSPDASWIENLDVDENILLASQMRDNKSHDELYKQALSYCHQVGLSGLPATRPSDTDSRILHLMQWVRALMCDPLEILILENTLEYEDDKQKQISLDIIKDVLGKGTSVLYLYPSTNTNNNVIQMLENMPCE